MHQHCAEMWGIGTRLTKLLISLASFTADSLGVFLCSISESPTKVFAFCSFDFVCTVVTWPPSFCLDDCCFFRECRLPLGPPLLLCPIVLLNSSITFELALLGLVPPPPPGGHVTMNLLAFTGNWIPTFFVLSFWGTSSFPGSLVDLF